MKNTYTVKEIMEGTGLTRQRVHVLIKSRGIPVHKDKSKFVIKWDDLLKVTDNTTMLSFLRNTLHTERQKIDDSYKALKGYSKSMIYAFVLLLEKQFPTPEGTDTDWISLLQKAEEYTQSSAQVILDYRRGLYSERLSGFLKKTFSLTPKSTRRHREG